MPGGTGGGAKHWRKAKYLAIQGADAFYYANAAVNLKRPPGYDYRKSANKVKIDHKGKVFTYVLSGMVRFLASWNFLVYRRIAKTSRTYIKMSSFKIRVIFEILLNSIVLMFFAIFLGLYSS